MSGADRAGLELQEEKHRTDAGAIDRRAFLALGIGAVVGGSALAVGLSRGGDDDGTGDAPVDRSGTPPPSGDESVRAIGDRYLEVVPDESTAPILRDRLPPALSDARAGEQTAAVDEAVRVDFARGDVIELDGWILSLTECRLAALAVVT